MVTLFNLAGHFNTFAGAHNDISQVRRQLVQEKGGSGQSDGVNERLTKELAVDPDLEVVAAFAGDGQRGILEVEFDGGELFLGRELTLSLGERLAGAGIDVLGLEVVLAFGLGEFGVQGHGAAGREALDVDFIKNADERDLACSGIFGRHITDEGGDEHRFGLVQGLGFVQVSSQLSAISG